MQRPANEQLKSPAVMLGLLAIGVEVLLFFLDRTLPTDQPTEAIRDAISWVGGAAPWLVPALAAFCAGVLYFFGMRSASAELHAVRIESEGWRAKAAELEQTVAELKRAESQTAAEQPKYLWLRGWEEGHGELLIPNSDLERFYERAVESLRQRHLTADFSAFSVFADPFLDLALFPWLEKGTDIDEFLVLDSSARVHADVRRV